MQNHLVKTPITQIRNILEDVVVQLSALSQRIFRSKAKKQQGSLRIAINKGTPQYYHITTKGDTNGKYIPKSDSKLISSLAQKEYLEKCNRIIERQQKALARFLKDFHPEDIIAVHTNLTEAKRRFVTPLLLTDEEFAAQWQAKPYSGKFFAKDTPEHFTNSGLRVRSKSEVIIAECLARHNIPFRYEAPLELIIGDTSSITAETPTNNIRRPHAKQGSHILSRLHLLKQAHPSGIHLGTFWHDGQSQLRQKRYRKTTKLRCRWLHSRNKLYRHHRDDGSSPEHPLHRANDKIIANVNLSQPSHA